MTTQVKPGTLCECGPGHMTGNGHRHECPRDAVRMVTVKIWDDENEPSEREVPMCAACAKYHESKVAK